jgi:hypothetical protein
MNTDLLLDGFRLYSLFFLTSACRFLSREKKYCDTETLATRILFANLLLPKLMMRTLTVDGFNGRYTQRGKKTAALASAGKAGQLNLRRPTCVLIALPSKCHLWWPVNQHPWLSRFRAVAATHPSSRELAEMTSE